MDGVRRLLGGRREGAVVTGRRKFHGRRHGKALRPAQARLVAELLPRLAIPGVGPPHHPARRAVDPAALFGDGRQVWLEIGFGGGEHLAREAAARREVGFVGCEPFVNGVAMLLPRIEALGLANVRIHPGDARDLIDLLPDGSLARVLLLYPDPWPKTRHRERRFMNVENLGGLARVMAAGAELRLATDVEDYVRHAVRAAAEAGRFALEGGPEEWRARLAELGADPVRGEGAARGTGVALPYFQTGLGRRPSGARARFRPSNLGQTLRY
jgi:tRNA (guanine-N7-)-methyltransferase